MSKRCATDIGKVFHKLKEILEGIRRGKDIYGQGKERSGRRMVVLD